jgi:DNA polymerase (family 10)
LSNGTLLLRRLLQLNAIDPTRIDALQRDGILTRADYELAVAEGRAAVADLSLPPATGALASEAETLTLGRALEILEALIDHLRTSIPAIESIVPSGEVRRFVQSPAGLVVVALVADAASALASAAALPAFSNIVHRSGRRLIARYQGHEIDMRFALRDEVGSLLFVTTGPPEHVAEVRKRGGTRLFSSERDLYSHAGLNYLPPEVRDSPEARRDGLTGPLPRLVERADIRGDLHLHTTYSDGRDTLRDMVAGCCALGYEYIAITDHSEHAATFRTLDSDGLRRQADEIARMRDAFPQIAILHGIEADILSDGRIDCDDAVMASLDIVLASLHEADGDNGRRLTKRCLSAIQHPLVSVITHPQNQLVGRRAGYDMAYDAIYEAAVATGTVLEIDGSPAHLDLDGEHAAAAIAAGVTVSIDSDCHRARLLSRQMTLGVGTARRGRVEARHVLNARPLNDVKAFIARKRQRT